MARILGLDIGSNTVRAALVRTALRSASVVRYAELPLVGAPGPAGRAASLRDAMRELLLLVGGGPDAVIVALPGDAASLRVVELPAAAARRIDDVLPFELENLMPFALDEAVIDHQPIATVGGKLRLLAAAAPKERVANMLAELREATVDPREVAVGAASLDGLVPLIPALEAGGPFLLLDLGETDAAICILSGGRAELARTISGGMAAMPNGAVPLAKQIQQTVASYRAAGGNEVRGCYVSGGRGALREAVPWIANELGLAVQPLPMPPAPGADDANRADFARALALGGRGATRGKHIDLRRGEFATKRTMGAMRQHATLIAGCVAAVFVAFSFSTYARWSALDSRREALATELAKVTEETLGEKTTDVKRARELLDGQSGPADPLPHFDAFDTLDAISAAIPTEVVHDTRRLTIEIGDEGRPGHFELQGSVATIGERDRIAEELRRHACFKDLETGRTTPAVGQDRLNYQIEADISCPGDTRVTKRRSSTSGSR